MASNAARNRPLLTDAALEARLGELYAAIDQFNRGWYFEAHETLEGLWLVAPEPDRTFLQGIIQLAAAFVHLARGERTGFMKLLDAAEGRLRPFAPGRHRVDVARLLEAIERWRAEPAAGDARGWGVSAFIATAGRAQPSHAVPTDNERHA